MKILSDIYWIFFKKRNFSQGNEESILVDIFKMKSNGFYLDVGCHHPMRFSNTAALYKRGWTGINIDGDKRNLRLFKIFRKKDINLNYLVSNCIKDVTFYFFKETALNGILSQRRIDFLNENSIRPLKKEKIRTTTLNEILQIYFKNRKNKIDFLTIDVEGHDFEVLKSIDLDKYFVKLILIEVNENKKLVDIYLKKNGYNLFGIEDRNMFYIKNDN
tara:strand:+ start:66 stop:716 length:651 start_codon:yes stop_codon:yes gene_type:complete